MGGHVCSIMLGGACRNSTEPTLVGERGVMLLEIAPFGDVRITTASSIA
jgi:hypothetical protein